VSYESVKRLTDILALSATLPSVRPISSNYIRLPDNNSNTSATVSHSDSSTDVDSLASSTTTTTTTTPPNIYLTHPGVIASTLFPVPWFLIWAYKLALIVCRFIGSAWHTVDGYTSGRSVTWLVLEEQSALDDMHAERIKWGSSSNRACEALVKKTEVEGWGWEGRVEDPADDASPGILNKTHGRRVSARNVTSEELQRFEESGVHCWLEMERLRLQWEDILSEDL
jgi:3-keto steroid reductase